MIGKRQIDMTNYLFEYDEVKSAEALKELFEGNDAHAFQQLNDMVLMMSLHCAPLLKTGRIPCIAQALFPRPYATTPSTYTPKRHRRSRPLRSAPHPT